MKTFFLVFLLSSAAGYEVPEATVNYLTDKCIKETGVSEENVANFKKYIFDDNDPKLKEYLLCFWKTLGAINEDNSLNEKKFATILTGSEDEVKKLMEECIAKEGRPQDIYYEAYKCFHRNSPEN